MLLPTVILEPEKLDSFDLQFKRYAQANNLKLTIREDGPARRYKLWQDEKLKLEVDAAPIADKLELQIISDDSVFCLAVYNWLREKYYNKNKGHFANSINNKLPWPLPLVTAGLLETMAQWPAADDTDSDKALRRQFSEDVGKGLPTIQDEKTTPQIEATQAVYHYHFPTSQMTRAEKLEAYLDWAEQDTLFRPNYIDWAGHKFGGFDTDGEPKVKQKTLLGWKKYRQT